MLKVNHFFPQELRACLAWKCSSPQKTVSRGHAQSKSLPLSNWSGKLTFWELCHGLRRRAPFPRSWSLWFAPLSPRKLGSLSRSGCGPILDGGRGPAGVCTGRRKNRGNVVGRSSSVCRHAFDASAVHSASSGDPQNPKLHCFAELILCDSLCGDYTLLSMWQTCTVVWVMRHLVFLWGCRSRGKHAACVFSSRL